MQSQNRHPSVCFKIIGGFEAFSFPVEYSQAVNFKPIANWKSHSLRPTAQEGCAAIPAVVVGFTH